SALWPPRGPVRAGNRSPAPSSGRAGARVSPGRVWPCHDVLGVEPSSDSDFFESGGASLDAFKLATRAAERLPELEDVDVFLVGETFERPRFDDLAGALAERAAAAS